ncbi:Uncharacterized protein APZ42_028902 [Daphnia magna]|uniref:Transposable element P transposase-like RNase H C-terminal domain-containing protein n=1 Tax=Daphnia magna TaxID=35525 RepID=A0A164Q1S1_9CRUS|nr:Uncharacterized protein APZ42_028902 [Daphnia magna]
MPVCNCMQKWAKSIEKKYGAACREVLLKLWAQKIPTKSHANLLYYHICSLLIQSGGELKLCKFCKLVDKALRLQFKRHKTIQMHTKLNHNALGVSILPNNELENEVLLCGDSEDDFHSESEEQLSLIKRPPVIKIDLEWSSLAATVYDADSSSQTESEHVKWYVVELLLRENHRYVLTGKLNQDCIERFFWIIRMSGRCGYKPTAASFLELFRLLTLYYTTKKVLRGANWDGEERNVVLTSYSSCIKKRFSNNKKLMKEKRDYFRDILLQGIMREMDLVDNAGN